MHNLAMLRENGGKAHLSTIRVGDAVHLSGHKLLGHSGTYEAHGCGMHLVTNLGSMLHLFNLLSGLGGAHLHDGHDEVHGRRLLLLVGVNAQQIKDLEFDVVAVGRQEVNLALQAHGLVADGAEGRHRSRVADAHLSSKIGHAVHRAIPHDVFDVDVVAYEGFRVVVHVNHAHQPVALLSEVIEERRVLTKWIVGVVGIVVGRFVVAEQHDDAVSHELLQFVAAVGICFFTEHAFLH